MNETEYITDVPPLTEYISEDSTESDISSVTEVSETLETTVSAASDVDNLTVIANNTSGILLMVTAIFFAVVIAFIAKIFGGYFSM